MSDKKLVSLLQPNITFVMIKQDAIRNGVMDDIIGMIENDGFNILVSMDPIICKLDEKQIIQFYKEHFGRSYFDDLYASIALGARPLILEYPKYDTHAWEKMRKLIGATNARNAEENTIRGKFGGHKFDSEAPMAANAIHASDSLASVMREIEIIFPDVHDIYTSHHGTVKLKNILVV